MSRADVHVIPSASRQVSTALHALTRIMLDQHRDACKSLDLIYSIEGFIIPKSFIKVGILAQAQEMRNDRVYSMFRQVRKDLLETSSGRSFSRLSHSFREIVRCFGYGSDVEVHIGELSGERCEVLGSDVLEVSADYRGQRRWIDKLC